MKWEYKTSYNDYAELLKLGERGWEAFAVTRNSSGSVTYYLKRPINDQNNEI